MMRARALLAGAVALALVSLTAWAATVYPALTGRVVDGANIIQPDARQRLDAKLADLEQKSQIQLVVATVASLQGEEIEPYANELFRNWKLGEAKKNNGVLLLVAPNEKRVRIEVGYGLEGTLTDALSKVVIVNAMTPRFKAGDYSGGIERGVDDVVTVLTTDSADWQKKSDLRAEDDGQTMNALMPFLFIVVVLIIWVVITRNRPRGPWGRGGGGPMFIPMGGSSFGGGSWGGGGGGFGGGFSGGGGSSGGGGASGGW